MAVARLQLDALQVLALAALGVAVGSWLKQRVRALDRLEMPPAVVGGMLWAVLLLVLRDRWLNVDMDMVLRDILMVAFFTSVGLNARLRLVRQGGPQLIVFWAVAGAGALLQGLVGIGAAAALQLNPLVGLVCGPVTLAGGPATAIAFGSTFEQMGLGSATTLGIAAAMFGITAAGLLSGFAGGRLIEKQ
ncbi:MAG: hypothetical protein NZM33_06775, partial [Bryobacteraceae bacterium]|nr:hypothetical protein [Bryobacteraceae bacterium]